MVATYVYIVTRWEKAKLWSQFVYFKTKTLASIVYKVKVIILIGCDFTPGPRENVTQVPQGASMQATILTEGWHKQNNETSKIQG